jgi:hypothetical protein
MMLDLDPFVSLQQITQGSSEYSSMLPQMRICKLDLAMHPQMARPHKKSWYNQMYVK